MPDIQVATTFIKKLTSVEESYLRAVEAKRRELRRVWLDIITREGVSRVAVGQMQSEVQALRNAIATLGRDAGKDIRRTVGNYTRKQVDMAKRAGLDVIEPVQLEVANTQVQREGEEAFLTSSPVWLDTLESNLDVAAARLRLAGADEAAILARLVADGIGDGRASLWQSSGNAAQTEETRDVWTYASGLIAAYLATMNQQTTAEYKKQAIATIDERTTNCCLKVHGQIQPLDKPFRLTGTPRFGDYIQDPPFHWYAIVAGELCVTNEGYKPIEDVKIGDMVLTHKGRYKPVTMALHRVFSGEGLLIETDHGKIKITPEHPVLTLRGWVKAGNLFVGDVILGCDEVHNRATASPESSGVPVVQLGAHNFDSQRREIGVLDCVLLPSGAVSAPVYLDSQFEGGEIEINDVTPNWVLKNKLFPLGQSNGFKPIHKCHFNLGGICSVCGGTTDSHLFSNARHSRWVIETHPSGGGWVSDADTGMSKSFPFILSGFEQSPALNSSLAQSPFDDITRNLEFFSNSVFSHSAFVKLYDLLSVKFYSIGHNNLLTRHYNIKRISSLELRDTVICDLSVQDDESYCIADHYVHNCRTTEVLYNAAFEEFGITTEKMRDMADLELEWRETTGTRAEIYPSHATARRRGMLPPG